MRARPLDDDDGVGESRVLSPCMLNINYGNRRNTAGREHYLFKIYSLMQINRLTLIMYPIRVTEKFSGSHVVLVVVVVVPYENRFFFFTCRWSVIFILYPETNGLENCPRYIFLKRKQRLFLRLYSCVTFADSLDLPCKHV